MWTFMNKQNNFGTLSFEKYYTVPYFFKVQIDVIKPNYTVKCENWPAVW